MNQCLIETKCLARHLFKATSPNAWSRGRTLSNVVTCEACVAQCVQNQADPLTPLKCLSEPIKIKIWQNYSHGKQRDLCEFRFVSNNWHTWIYWPSAYRLVNILSLLKKILIASIKHNFLINFVASACDYLIGRLCDGQNILSQQETKKKNYKKNLLYLSETEERCKVLLIYQFTLLENKLYYCFHHKIYERNSMYLHS